MQELSRESDLQLVSGGFGAYDVGNAIGTFCRSTLITFEEMGRLYTPIL